MRPLLLQAHAPRRPASRKLQTLFLKGGCIFLLSCTKSIFSIPFSQENIDLLRIGFLYTNKMEIKDWIVRARKHAKITQQGLGDALSLTKGNISAWENGRHEPSFDQLKRIAEITLYPEALPGLSVTEPNAAYISKGKAVPLISWVQAGHWCEAIDLFEPGDAEDWLYCPRNHSASTFALRVRGVSMEPKYRDGAIIYVDPEKSADHLSNVIVRLVDEDEVTFKQLVIEGSKRFLRPLNPEWPGPKLIEIDASAHVCGVVIGQFIED